MTDGVMQLERTYPVLDHGAESAKRAKLSINVNHDVSERLRNLAYSHRLSESSIVEIALKQLFLKGDDTQIGALLNRLGATLKSK